MDINVRDFEHWCREVLPELATFHAACKFKTRTRAGEKLGKTGSNVGKSITKLEGLLKDSLSGGSLVDHAETRKVCPTEAGDELFRHCERLDALRSELLGSLDRLQRGSEIRLAMTHYAWLAYGNELETTYKERRKDGMVNFGDKFYGQDKVWQDIEREVSERRADAGVYSYPPSRDKEVPADLMVRNWIEEEIVLVLPAEFARRLKREPRSLADLPELPRVVHYDRSLGFDRTDTIEAYLKQQGVLKRLSEDWLLGVNTIPEIEDTLLQKGGMSFLPWPTVEREHRNGKLRAFRLHPAMRPRVIKIICRLHTSRRALLDFLKAADSLAGPRKFPGE